MKHTIATLTAFWMGLVEFRSDFTTNCAGLEEAYDRGREFAHRLTMRHFESACSKGMMMNARPTHTTGLLTVIQTAPGCTAWRTTEPDAPGLFALVSDERGLAIPLEPETDDLTIAIFNERVDETLGSVVLDGRAGLIRWYLQNVGHEPDEAPEGPLPIMQLIDQVAGHLLLRHFEQGVCPNGSRPN